MWKWIIIGVVIASLGAGAYVYFGYLPGKNANAEGKPEIEHKAFFEMDTFLLNLADPGGKRYLKVTVKLELDDPKVSEELTAKNYEVRDTALMLMSGKEFEDISTLAGKESLKRELITRLNGLLQTGQIKQMYFTEFLVQ